MLFNFNSVHITSHTENPLYSTTLRTEDITKIQLSVICPHMVDFAGLVTYYILSQ